MRWRRFRWRRLRRRLRRPRRGTADRALTHRQGVLNVDVLCPVMPFADAGRPSMGVSLLAAEAQAAGYSAKVMYFNLDLAGDMGLEPYQRIATTFPPNLLIGEWFFADDLFGADIPGA